MTAGKKSERRLSPCETPVSGAEALRGRLAQLEIDERDVTDAVLAVRQVSTLPQRRQNKTQLTLKNKAPSGGSVSFNE
jgi:uncharacterized protein YbbK (DUF523 family)